MDIRHAERIAIALMQEHGIWAKGWRFGWNTNKRTLGICRYAPKKIELSQLHVPANSVESVTNTILHEIAHALAGNRAGHGYEWRRICLAIGGDGKRCSDSEASIAAAWIGRCKNGHETKQHRAPLRVSACGRCAPVYRPENVIVWRKDGRRVPLGSMPRRYVQEALRLKSKHGDLLPL